MPEFVLHPKLAADCFTIASLRFTEVLLLNDSRYPWCILVPRVAQLTELMQLDAQQAQQLFTEIKLVSQALADEPGITKLNVGALGNLVPQLHIHVIGRSPIDAAWPGPVWGFGEATPYRVEQAQHKVARLRLLWQDYLNAL